MNNGSEIDQQVKRLHEEVVELVKRYQFRDRNEMTCCGVSVSQCYALDAIHRYGPLSMNQLAEKLCLKISTVTRILEPVIKKGFVRRSEEPHDRRIRTVRLTEPGRAVLEVSWRKVLESEKAILLQFPESSRELLIQFLGELNKAVSHWQTSCCEE